MAVARVYLTGGIAVEHGAALVTGAVVSTRQAQLVLAALAWRPGKAVDRQRLREVLWPDEPPPSADTAIATVVSSLRHALAPTGLSVSTAWSAYTLAGDDGDAPWVDVDAARRSLHAAEGALHAGRMPDVYAASGVVTSITRRTLLAGIDGPWVEERRRELAALRARGLRCAVLFCTWNDEHEAAVAHARTLVGLDPLSERSQRLLMEAQIAAGDRAAALVSYDRFRRLLADELGVDPDERTSALHRRLLGRPVDVGPSPRP